MLRRTLLSLTLVATLVAAGPLAAHPRPSDASTVSALSLLVPVAASVAVPAAFVSTGAALTVVSVHAVAGGTVWLLERASDGARCSITVAGRVAETSLVGAGTAVVVTALSAGWLLSAVGEAIVFIPNEIGQALLHDQQLTR